ncbi:hypothetical protein LTS02_006458 [Friedmanniomyces endolithicus]|nr:hypothetical protein LTS02_006458 [Friedmanniomyces endolithicus]
MRVLSIVSEAPIGTHLTFTRIKLDGEIAAEAEYKSTPDSRYDGMRTRTSRDIMLDIAGLPQLSKECATRVPPPGAKIEDFLSRWSNTKVSLPAAVIVPANEEDIRAVIKYAACQGLRVLPVAGAHGTFVPIDDRCVYLDLSRFNTIELDEDAGAATFGGGGAITEAMIRTLGERGFYTSVPTSSAVGMAGYYLGGGSSPYNGLKGLAIDHILHIRIITADGESRDLSPSSPRKEDAVLFNVLCGAGLGFGVIPSITLRVWRTCFG